MRPGRSIVAFLALGFGVLMGVPAALAAGPGDAPMAPRSGLSPERVGKARHMIEKAVGYLRTAQDPATGGWGVNPKGPTFTALTGLVLSGMMSPGDIGPDDPAVAAGEKFLLNYVQPDGGIYDKALPIYNTAISVSALAKFTDPRAKDAVKNAADFLKKLQYGEGAVVLEGNAESAKPVSKSDSFYGGWGYGRHGRPDLSNTAFALEALHAAGVEPADPAFQRALVFLQRVQMQEVADGKKVNDMPYAVGSAQGGFIYATGVNKDRVGVGQSFAGETIESLTEGPGCEVTITLKNGADGKPITLKREEIEKRVSDMLASSSDMHVTGTARSFVVALGKGSDGASANVFSVRCAIEDPVKAKLWVPKAFADLIDNADAVKVARVEAWKGVSRLRAYGSMTYSGFKSYLYAGLSDRDERVQAARRWICEHYTLAENPGLGTDGMYYYYVVFSRALGALGQAEIDVREGAAARRARWADDLVERLGELQNPDGSFRSVDARWMEDNPTLITAYALIALREATR